LWGNYLSRSVGARARSQQDPTFEVAALFENLPGTSMWLTEIAYDPETRWCA